MLKYVCYLFFRLMLQDSTEEQSSSSSSSKRGRYEYRDGSGPSSGQPPPSYTAQRVSMLIMLYVNGALHKDVQGIACLIKFPFDL